jgi:putative transposase
MERFRLLKPHLEDGVPLSQIAGQGGLRLRTARRWVRQYRKFGLIGLCRKANANKGKPRRFSPKLFEIIEGLALQRPPLSVAAIHRKIVTLAQRLGEPPPSYGTVYTLYDGLRLAL